MIRRMVDFVVIAQLLALGPIVFVLMLGPWIEKQFSPVTTFAVTTVTCQGGCVTVSGWMRKERACEFVETYARAAGADSIPRVVPVEYRDKNIGKSFTRPTGPQQWGPWYIEASSGEHVTLYARHRCHPFWTTETLLAEVKVP